MCWTEVTPGEETSGCGADKVRGGAEGSGVERSGGSDGDGALWCKKKASKW